MGARILIIEDNPTNMELMAYLLSAFGHTPLMAFDGESGLQMAALERPALILCDVHLPKLDGYGVVAALKADPALAATPVLAVTALAMVGDRERLLEAGFDGYVAKPIEPEQFVGQFQRYLPDGAAAHGATAEAASGVAGGGAAPPGSGAAGAGRGDHADAGADAAVLVVDDDAFMRELLRELLEGAGHRVLCAADAAEGIALLGGHAVGVVICDQYMALTTGAAFFERVRQLAPWCYRLMLTGVADNDAMRLAEQRGDIELRLAKPFDAGVLRAAVADGLRQHASRARA